MRKGLAIWRKAIIFAVGKPGRRWLKLVSWACK